ncbi:MAG: helix-turn-helix transcriptional regulator [Blastocatellia bacterium]|nr:helix-turn-helix transcriptional regulator [Blastocatellia bacterium]
MLLTLPEDPAAWRHEYDLCRETGLKAGSMYPILIRLADRGWLETMWETEIPAGRPPRHLPRLTEWGSNRRGNSRRSMSKGRPPKRGARGGDCGRRERDEKRSA